NLLSDIRLQPARNILAYDVGFDVNRVAYLQPAERRHVHRVRDESNRECELTIGHSWFERRNRKADAIYGHGPFLDEQRSHLSLKSKRQAFREAFAGDSPHLPEPVDVPCHQVATEAVRKTNCPLEVHRITGLDELLPCPTKGLNKCLHLEPHADVPGSRC